MSLSWRAQRPYLIVQKTLPLYAQGLFLTVLRESFMMPVLVTGFYVQGKHFIHGFISIASKILLMQKFNKRKFYRIK